MDGGNEQSCHKILFQSRSTATETLVLVQKAYGNKALKRSNFFGWYSRFRDRRVEDDERGGRPKSTRTVVNIALLFIRSKVTVESHKE